jgi:ubiquinone/menaquinone biosynthesis C-methylase UbiE
MNDLEYFNYLKNRSKLRFVLRKMLYLPLLKEINGKFLDVGCGLGGFLEMYGSGYGIDPNKNCVDFCRRKGLKCFKGSIYKIPFKSDTFDTVSCIHVLEHLDKPEKAIKEARRVLKTKGKLIIVVPIGSGFPKDPTHRKFWTEKLIRNLLTKYNFSTTKAIYFPNPIRRFHSLPSFNELRIISIKE